MEEKPHEECEIETEAWRPYSSTWAAIGRCGTSIVRAVSVIGCGLKQDRSELILRTVVAGKRQAKGQREQKAVNFLRNDPPMRRMFIDRVAAPVANKMFECGMIP
jgi:hypothetical protein